jgi:hypothetical protein
MHERNQEARGLASFALGSLTMKESSAEAAVRSVYRIANLRDQYTWQVWAQLQLTELVDEDAARESVQRVLDGAFPESTRQDAILAHALEDYLATRVRAGETGSYYLADVGDIERDLVIYEASLMRDINVEHLVQRDFRQRILNRVKNRAQTYLMEVEKRTIFDPSDTL